MGWFEDLNKGLGFISNPVGSALGNWADPIGGLRENAVKNIAGQINPGYGEYLNQQGNPISTGSGSRDADFAAGRARGQEIFYDPEMQGLKSRYEDLSKGYSGQELGALKGQALQDLRGQRAGYSQALSGRLARAGVGGARAAAIQGQADQGYNKNLAQFERGLTADNANQIRQGFDKYSDFAMRQKYGTLGTELGYGQLGVNERGAQAASQANQSGKKEGLFGLGFLGL